MVKYMQVEEERTERRRMKMALTRDFRETVQARAKRDPAFRKGLLSEALESYLSGEATLGKELLRDYINATVGFPRLAANTENPRKDPSPDVWPTWQPDHRQSVRNCCLFAARGRRASEVRSAHTKLTLQEAAIPAQTDPGDFKCHEPLRKGASGPRQGHDCPHPVRRQ